MVERGLELALARDGEDVPLMAHHVRAFHGDRGEERLSDDAHPAAHRAYTQSGGTVRGSDDGLLVSGDLGRRRPVVETVRDGCVRGGRLGPRRLDAVGRVEAACSGLVRMLRSRSQTPLPSDRHPSVTGVLGACPAGALGEQVARLLGRSTAGCDAVQDVADVVVC